MLTVLLLTLYSSQPMHVGVVIMLITMWLLRRCLSVYYQLVSYMCFTRSSMYMYPEQQVMTLTKFSHLYKRVVFV